MIFIHRKRAESHEKQLDNILYNLNVLEQKVSSDQDSQSKAIQVLTDQIARTTKVKDRIAKLREV